MLSKIIKIIKTRKTGQFSIQNLIFEIWEKIENWAVFDSSIGFRPIFYAKFNFWIKNDKSIGLPFIAWFVRFFDFLEFSKFDLFEL
jgi:hypothetical protein